MECLTPGRDVYSPTAGFGLWSVKYEFASIPLEHFDNALRTRRASLGMAIDSAGQPCSGRLPVPVGQRNQGTADDAGISGRSQHAASLHGYAGILLALRSRYETGDAIGFLGGYPITTLPCKDGYVTFSPSAPQQRDLLRAMIGREDVLEDPVFGTFPRLKEVADEIDDILRAWTHDKIRQEIVQLAAATWSVPVSPHSGYRRGDAGPSVYA